MRMICNLQKSKLIFISAMMLFLFPLSSLFSQQDSSVILNKRGYEYYKMKEYYKAADVFSEAIQINPSNYIANYNLACAYAILTTRDTICNQMFYVKTINALEGCLSLDSTKTIEKARNDKDFDSLRSEYEFNVLIYNLNFENPEHVRGFIVNKTYWTSAPGSSFYPINQLTINDDNSWILTFYKVEENWDGELEGTTLDSKEGLWKLEGHVLILMNKSSDVEFKRITLEEPGVIDGLYYPDPNDMSGESGVRHYWQCGKCGCKEIEGL